MSESCRICGTEAEVREVDVPAGTTLCPACIEKYAWQCDCCKQEIAPDSEVDFVRQSWKSPPAPAERKPNQFPVSNPPIFGQWWCDDCYESHTAICENCEDRVLPQQLEFRKKTLSCAWCRRRYEVLVSRCINVRLNPWTWKASINYAVSQLPCWLRDAIELFDVSDDDRKIIVHRLPGASDDNMAGEREFSLRASKHTGDFEFVNDSYKPVIATNTWYMEMVTPDSPVQYFNCAWLFEVDVEMIVLKELSKNLCVVGNIGQDQHGRYIGKDGKPIFDWQFRTTKKARGSRRKT